MPSSGSTRSPTPAASSSKSRASLASQKSSNRDQLTDDAWAPLNLVTRKPVYIPDYDTPRFRLTPAHTAFTKIAEGCNHPCSFCVIPQMRGTASLAHHRVASSREVRALVAEGVKEINLITQDTTYFGMDLWAEKAGPRAAGRFLARARRSRTLLRELRQDRRRFLDSPALHASGALERRTDRTPSPSATRSRATSTCRCSTSTRACSSCMRRETSSEHIETLIARIRAGIPGIAIRTTFIVGFPGETEEEFEDLLDFIERTRFERLGVFTYSQEEGSRAAKMDGPAAATSEERALRRAMNSSNASRARSPRHGWAGAEIAGRSTAYRPLGSGRAGVDTSVILAQAAPVGEFIRRTDYRQPRIRFARVVFCPTPGFFRVGSAS